MVRGAMQPEQALSHTEFHPQIHGKLKGPIQRNAYLHYNRLVSKILATNEIDTTTRQPWNQAEHFDPVLEVIECARPDT